MAAALAVVGDIHRLSSRMQVAVRFLAVPVAALEVPMMGRLCTRLLPAGIRVPTLQVAVVPLVLRREMQERPEQGV